MYFFLQTSWKHGLSKKIALEYDLSCIIGKDDISFNRKYDLTPRRKMKDNLSKKKIHENMIFSLNVLKRWSSQKGSSWDMIFFVLSGKVVFFSRKHGIFSRTENERESEREREREREKTFLKKYTETWYFLFDMFHARLSKKKSRMILSRKRWLIL